MLRDHRCSEVISGERATAETYRRRGTSRVIFNAVVLVTHIQRVSVGYVVAIPRVAYNSRRVVVVVGIVVGGGGVAARGSGFPETKPEVTDREWENIMVSSHKIINSVWPSKTLIEGGLHPIRRPSESISLVAIAINTKTLPLVGLSRWSKVTVKAGLKLKAMTMTRRGCCIHY